MERNILFDKYEFPIIKGLDYLINKEDIKSDYLFINEEHDSFSMHFEKGFPVFKIPKNLERNYCFFELKRQNRIIKFFCPEKQKNLDSVIWYFYVELIDELGQTHILPGQVRVEYEETYNLQLKGIPKFIEILEKVKLHRNNS